MTLPPLSAETLFHIGNFPVTNTYVNSTLTVIGFAIVGWIISRKTNTSKLRAPTGIVNFAERILEILLGYFDGVTRSRAKSIQFLPIVGTLFLFILISNWIGLLPGIGSIGIHAVHEGHIELIPLFRSANTDLNLTLAMSVTVIVLSHVLGIAVIGFFKYANKFIKLGDIWQAVKTGKPMNIIISFVEFIVGLLEVFSEIAKMVSLSLRLFGNVFAGEVLMTVLASLIAFIVPLPFMALELLVGIVQATVFSMLTLVYLTIAITPVHGHGEEHGQQAAHTA